MKAASETKIDAVTFDGAGSGTGMSPVPMIDECATPTVYLEAQVLKCLEIFKKKGKHILDITMAGGFMNETQIFKAIAMSNFGDGPYVKAISMARAPIAAVMKATYFTELAKEGKLPSAFAKLYGDAPEKFFAVIPELKKRFGDDWKKPPPGAIGLYSYFVDRIGTGLRQLMARVRK